MADMHVTYEQLEQTAQQLRGGHEELETVLHRLRSLVSDLVSRGFVTTRASGAFDQASEDFTQGARQTLSGLQSMAQFLTGAAATLRNTDEQLARSIDGHR